MAEVSPIYIDEHDLLQASGMLKSASSIWDILSIDKPDQLVMSYLTYLLAYHPKTERLISQLLDDGADPNFTNELREGPIRVSKRIRLRIDEVYLGASTVGRTILGSVDTKKNTLSVLKLLLDRGADPNKIAYSGHTPLRLSIVNSRPEFAALLLLYGADSLASSIESGFSDTYEIAKGHKWAVSMLNRWNSQ